MTPSALAGTLSFKLRLLATCIALAACGTSSESVVHAGKASSWRTPNCTGTPIVSNADFTSGKCAYDAANGYSASTACAGAQWTLGIWYTSTSCEGVATVTLTGFNSSCQNIYYGTNFAFSATIDCGGCFSAASTLQLESGAAAPIADVRVGDRVLAVSSGGQPFYDKVFRITHHEPTETMEFVRIGTSTGHVLEVTGTHRVHVGSCCAQGSAVPASQVAAGSKMFITVAGGDSRAVTEVIVTSVETVSATGVFNIHTLGGNVVINGLAATHYGHAAAWTFAPSMAPLWYRAVDAVSSVLGAEDASQKARASATGTASLRTPTQHSGAMNALAGHVASVVGSQGSAQTTTGVASATDSVAAHPGPVHASVAAWAVVPAAAIGAA